MSESVLLVEQRTIDSGPIEIWTVNRPKVLNALNSQVLQAIFDAGGALKRRLDQDLMSCRALIVRGAGEKAFVAGADIAELQGLNPAQAEAFGRLGQRAFTQLEFLPIPTIAAIHGFALGGGLELAMGCDMLVASPVSEFGQPEAYLGLLPGFGATARFADRVGTAKALELLYTGRRIKADEALRLGLIQEICSADKPVFDRALELAREMTIKSGPLALAAIKRVTRLRTEKMFAEIMDAEAKAFGQIFGSADKLEGTTAFLEKRKAAFKGR